MLGKILSGHYLLTYIAALSIFLAGADMLITYYAREIADAIRRGDIG